MKNHLLLILALGLCASLRVFAHAADIDQAVLKAEADRVAVVAKASASTLAIFARGGQGGGSGVIISADGFALSNYHVTRGAGNAMKCGLNDGKLYDAVIVGIDPVGDVALVKLFGRDDFPAAELADSDQVRVGDWCFAIGNPFLLATDFHPSVSYGIVSGVHRWQAPAGTLLEYADCIQTDAAINPGNSGGPLFNAQGQLIGINGRGSFEKRGRVNVGVGYAISMNQIKNFLGYLKSGRIVDHATLGAQIGTNEDGRVLVREILETCDAFRRGLAYDDEIVAFGGRFVHTRNAYKNALGIFPKDWRVPLTYQREGKRYDTLVRLQGVHSAGDLIEQVQGKKNQPLQPPGQNPRPPMPGKPGDPSPDGQPPDGQPVPRPRVQPPPAQKPAEMPAIVKKHYEARSGYANYYFNRIAQERIGKGLSSRGDFSAVGGVWTLEGNLAGGGAASFVIAADKVTMKVPNGEAAIAIEEDLGAALDPPQSGGMLASLYLWKRLLHGGLKNFGDVYYLGTLPLPGHAGLVDCLVGTQGKVECRFLTDPATGHLLAMEMFADEDLDPCEIYFSEYGEIDGRFLPRRWEVRHGDHVYGVFNFTSFKLEKSAAP